MLEGRYGANEGEKTAGLSSGELEQMRNLISDGAGDCTSALHCLITAFNRDFSFLTDRPTKREIYKRGMKHLSHLTCTATTSRVTHTYSTIQMHRDTVKAALSLRRYINFMERRATEMRAYVQSRRVCQRCGGQLFGWGII